MSGHDASVVIPGHDERRRVARSGSHVVIGRVGVERLEVGRIAWRPELLGDFGSPGDPADFKAVYAYSALSQRETCIVTGDHDARVMPAHSFKFGSLQASQSGRRPACSGRSYSSQTAADQQQESAY